MSEPKALERRVCGAKTRAGGMCKLSPLTGKSRCKLHGGASPSGKACANFKHGRYSKDLPTRLAARYAEAERDPELLSAKSDVALLHVRVCELVKQLSTGESGTLWEQLRESWDAVRAAGGEDELRAALASHGRAIAAGAKEEAIWRELADAIDGKSRVAHREHQRLVDLQQMMSVEQAMALVGALLAVIDRHILDAETRTKIGTELAKLLDLEPRGGILAYRGPTTEIAAP